MSDVNEIIEDLFLAWVFASPFGVGFEGKGVQMAPNVLDTGQCMSRSSETGALHSSSPGIVDHSMFRPLGFLSRR